MRRPAEAPSASPLRSHNVRLFAAGQGLSNIGTFAQIVAVSLLTLDLTGSSLALGVVMAAQFLPLLLIGPAAGVLLDRVVVRRLLIVTSLIAASQAALLGVIDLTGHMSIGWLVAMSFFSGLVQLFDRPGAQALLSELVAPDDLPKVVGISGSVQSIGRLGGPAIAGALYAWHGAGPCFLFNAASYGGVVISMVLLRKRDLFVRPPQPRARGQMREGLAFAWHSPLHRTTLIANAVVGGLAFNFPLFYSSLASLTFHAGPWVFATAETLNAVTAIAGGLWLGGRMKAPTTRTYSLACLALGVSLAWSALSPNPAVFLIGMLYFGVTVVVYSTVSQSLVQGATPPHLVGRIMTLFTMGLMGTTPLGGLIAGWITDVFSPRVAIGLGAASLFGAAAVVHILHRPPIATSPHETHYVEEPVLAGEVPEVAT